MEGELEVALVVQRHRRDLPERVLAVEHPAVGAREQRVGDVADALLDRRRPASPPGRCPGSTGAAGRAESRSPRTSPARASRTVHRRARDHASGSRKSMRVPLRARSARRASRAAMSALRSASSGGERLQARRVRPACRCRCSLRRGFHESSRTGAPMTGVSPRSYTVCWQIRQPAVCSSRTAQPAAALPVTKKNGRRFRRPFVLALGESSDYSRWCLPCMHLPAATVWLCPARVELRNVCTGTAGRGRLKPLFDAARSDDK